MHKIKCTVCEHEIDLPDKLKELERFTCPNCFAQLVLKILDGKLVARCAMCQKNFLECTEDCEKRIIEREKRGFFDIKL